MLDASKKTPLYRQLYFNLRNEIKEGRLKPGEQLPSERKIAAYYGISRLTVTKALKYLTREGYLKSHPGKGRFVNSGINSNRHPFCSFSEQMRALGKKTASKVLQKTILKADEALADRLEIPPGAEAVFIKRLRLADGEPVALDLSYLPYDACSRVDHVDLKEHSLYDVLEHKLGLKLQRARQTFNARLATPEEREILALQDPAAVLEIERTTFDDKGQVIEYVKMIYRGDRYTCSFSGPVHMHTTNGDKPKWDDVPEDGAEDAEA